MDKQIGYICGIDFQHEFDHPTNIGLYSTAEELKLNRTCWKQCGIVKVEIKVVKWVEPQDFEVGV